MMDMKVCEVCNQRKREKIKFEHDDADIGAFVVCQDCYDSIPKEYKKQLNYIKGGKQISVFPLFLGFIFGGYLGLRTGGLSAWFVGATAGALGGGVYKNKSISNWKITHNQKKYGYSDKDMGYLSIDIFDKHFELLDDKRQRAIMDLLEGKTKSRYYKKYIQDKV